MTQEKSKMPPGMNVLPRADKEMFSSLLSPRARMSEEIFRRKFLPFVSTVPVPAEVIENMRKRLSQVRQTEATVADLRANVITEWIKDVGKNTPYIEVDIYDENGKVLFTVPPLASNKIHVLDPSLPISRAIDYAENQSMILQEMGEKAMYETFVPAIVKNDMKLETIDRWNKIYEYYGLPLIDTKTKAEKDESQESQNSDTAVSSDPNDFY